jgi:NLR family CARD domain-containing protein 3
MFLKITANKISELDLEGNLIGDKALQIIWDGLSGDSSIKCLNLSKNSISDSGAGSLKEMLEYNISINALFLSWNEIRGEGIATISHGLMSNTSLKVIDLSFNPIGSMHTQRVKGIVELSNAFKINKSIVHIDLSYIGLNHEDCDLLNEGLKKNRTILGIHMLGNSRGLDSKGFCTSEVVPPSASHIFQRVGQSLKAGEIEAKDLDLNKWTNWWVWEGWAPMTFRFSKNRSNLPHSKFKQDEDVLIHLSIDRFEPDLMHLNPESTHEYILTRMVPPKTIQYYFSIEGIPRYLVDIESKSASVSKYPDLKHIQAKGGTIPWRLNISPSWPQNTMQIDLDYLEEIGCRPRPEIYVPKEIDLPHTKPKWKQETSVFKKYRVDNTKIFEQCFEFDWEWGRIPNMIKNTEEQQKVKKFLKQHYRLMREWYRYYAGNNPWGILPCIGQNAFNELISTTGIVDHNKMKLSDIDFEFIVTKSGYQKTEMNPERWLVRYQFMEIFVRIALHKYHKSKIVDSQYEAVEKLMNEHLIPVFSKFDCHKWRLENLWNVEWDEVFVKNSAILKKLFESYSGKYSKPSKPRFMSIEEFITLITESGALRYEVGHGNSVIGSQFNLAMMTHVDEINSNKHIQMFYYEFLEAIARVANKIKIFPNIDKYSVSPSKIEKQKTQKSASKDGPYSESESESDLDSNLSPNKVKSVYEFEKEEKSHIVNVEGKPLHVKLDIFIKLWEFSWIRKRNFYEIYED